MSSYLNSVRFAPNSLPNSGLEKIVLIQKKYHVNLRLTLLTMLLCSGLTHAQLEGPGFTAQQVSAGKNTYDIHCAVCHGLNLTDGEFGPPLRGRMFMQRWGGKSLDTLFIETATTMPTAAPRSLSDEVYADLLAYMLEQNGVRPGPNPLQPDPQSLAALLIPTYGPTAAGGLTAGAELPPPPTPQRVNPLQSITPVTENMLAEAPAGDWLTWRRTYDAMGYSPLGSVNKESVKNLRVAWTWTLPEGPSQVTPLVHDGVIFAHGFGDVLQALDGATGDLLWQYSHWLPSSLPATAKRSIAIHGNLLYLPTSDARIVALDVKSGSVVWNHLVGDVPNGYGMTGGPLVAKGTVMIGTTGRAPGGNYIVGLDAKTGEEQWRFYVIARPGEPGGNSWNGLLLEERNGGSVWVPGSFDPETGLAYFGVAQTYDTGPLLNLIDRAGVTNDALYTNSTLALDPSTGRLAWYFQHLPNDQWDLDWAFERQLIKLPVGGQEKKIVATSGKLAIYDFLEADSGQYISSMDLGLQNLVTAIDPETGAKKIDPELFPGRGKAIMVCPHPGGAKNWIPGSYMPDTKILYLPLMEFCMDLTPVPQGEHGSLSSGVNWTVRPWPDSDGNYGRLQAVNLQTQEIVWTHRQRAPLVSGVMATAGGVVFAGDLDRYFAAYDQDNGQELWRVRLNDVPNSAPISYEANGKQYVAVTVGHGGAISVDRTPLVPEIRLPSNPGAALWVFELPED